MLIGRVSRTLAFELPGKRFVVITNVSIFVYSVSSYSEIKENISQF